MKVLQERGALVFEPRRFVELRKKPFWLQFLSSESTGMGIFYTLNVFCIQARLQHAIQCALCLHEQPIRVTYCPKTCCYCKLRRGLCTLLSMTSCSYIPCYQRGRPGISRGGQDMALVALACTACLQTSREWLAH